MGITPSQAANQPPIIKELATEAGRKAPAWLPSAKAAWVKHQFHKHLGMAIQMHV
jgi:hypothetical protein